MATFTSTRAGSTFPVFKALGSGNLCVAYGQYDFAANPTANDVIEFCKLPAGAVAIGGWLRMEDIDTNVSPTFDIDIGWAANGTEAADTDGFGNFGVLNGSAVTNYLPEGGALIPLHGTLKDGPAVFTKETTVTGLINAAAATFAAATVQVAVLYVVP